MICVTSRAAAVPVRARGGRAARPQEHGVGGVEGEEAVRDDQGRAELTTSLKLTTFVLLRRGWDELFFSHKNQRDFATDPAHCHRQKE